MIVLVVLLGLVVVVLAVLVVGLLRSHAEILRALHELGAGVYADDETDQGVGPVSVPFRTRPGVAPPRTAEHPQAAAVVGSTPHGGAAHVEVVGLSPLTLLTFLTTGCSTCRSIWDALADPAERELDLDARIVVVTKGPEAESPEAVAALAPPGVTTVCSSEAWADYEVPMAPYFVLVDGTEGRVVGEGAASSFAQVRGLLGQALADRGFAADGSVSRRGRRAAAEREAAADEALRRAGIEPGDPSLYRNPVDEQK